jgi:hypothetical protein
MPRHGDRASLGTMTSGTVTRRLMLCVLLVGVVALIAGCGSSKPAFCKNVSELQKSVKNISASGGLSSLKTQLQTIETQAKGLVSSAKSDFPNETTAIDTAVSQLQTNIKALPSSPSAAQLAAVALDIKNAVTSVSTFASTSKDKCS